MIESEKNAGKARPPTAEERRREAAYLAAERAAIQADGCTAAELARLASTGATGGGVGA